MKILYILQDHNPFFGRGNVIGGHIAHIIGVIEAFQRLGHKIVIGSFDRVPYWNNNDVHYRLFKTSEMPVPKLRGLMRQWQLTNQIIEAIRETQPDFVYVRWTANLFFHRVNRIFADLPIVMECNTASEMYLGKSRPGVLGKWLARIADQGHARSATLISAVSAETKEFLLAHQPSLDPRRVIINPNGVDTNRFNYAESDIRDHHGIPRHSVVIGYAGNFCTWHRVDLLIHAFQGLELENIYLVIIGTGSITLEKSLRSVAAIRRSSQVIFTGPVPFDQMPEYLSVCDILVSPQSSSVGGKLHQSPIKLYEYMAVGRAVVGSRIGQICRVIEDGRNGLLFEPDSREDLERVLKRLVENQALREQLGRAARSEADQNHSWEANVSRILEALDHLKPPTV